METVRGGGQIFAVQPSYKNCSGENPTYGSGWIVQPSLQPSKPDSSFSMRGGPHLVVGWA